MYEIDLLRKLVSFKTDSMTKEQYKECAEFIVRECKRIGLKTRVVYARAPDKKPRPNVVADLDVGAEKTVILLTHYDVVPAGDGWKTDPFKLVVKDGKAYARGSGDDKGSIVAALSALRELNKKECKVNVRFIASCDEEVGGEHGAKYLAKKGIAKNADAVVILDSGLDNVAIGASGSVAGEIFVYGKQGHAGYPHKFRNALEDAIKLCAELMKYKKVRARHVSKLFANKGTKRKVWGRFSITILHSGEKSNVIPGVAKVGFDLRLIPEENVSTGEKEFRIFFNNARKKTDVRAKLVLYKGCSPYYSTEKHEFVRKFQELAKSPIGGQLGGNDGCAFAKLGKPMVSYGPLNDTSHTANEYVRIKDVIQAKNVLKKLCREGF